ncbi:TPA: hypothetical protein ACGHNR_004342, partial [Shigella flexneri]
LIMLPSETMIWQPEFTDKTLSRKPGAVQSSLWNLNFSISVSFALSAASLLLEIVSSSMRDKYSS